MATESTISEIPVTVDTGKLTVIGGQIGAAGEFENMYGSFSTAIGFDKNSTLVLKNVIVRGTGNAVSGCNTTSGNPTVIIEDSTLISDQNGFQLADPGNATLTNVNIEAAVCFFASGYQGEGSSIVINSGNYSASSHVFRVMNAASIEIKGGDFNFSAIENFASFETNGGTIKITGGTFAGQNYLDFFSNGQIIGGGTVSVNGTTVTITK